MPNILKEKAILGAGINTIEKKMMRQAVFMDLSDTKKNTDKDSKTSTQKTSTDLVVTVQVPLSANQANGGIQVSQPSSSAPATPALTATAGAAISKEEKNDSKKTSLAKKIEVNDREVEFNTHVFYSLTELQQKFDASLGLGIPTTGTEIKLDLSNIKKQSTQELYYVLELRCKEKEEFIDSPFFLNEELKNILSVSDDSKKLEEFFKKYGDSFVSSITYGRWAIVVVQFKLTSTEQQRQISAKLGQKIGAAELEAGFSSALEQKLQDQEYKIHAYTGGIDYTASGMLSSVSEISKLVEKFSIQDQKTAPAQISSKFTPYTLAINEEDDSEKKGKELTAYHEKIQKIKSNAIQLNKITSAAREIKQFIARARHTILIYLHALNASKINKDILRVQLINERFSSISHMLEDKDKEKFTEDLVKQNTLQEILECQKILSVYKKDNEILKDIVIEEDFFKLIEIANELKKYDLEFLRLEFLINQSSLDVVQIQNVGETLKKKINNLRVLIDNIPTYLYLPIAKISSTIIQKAIKKYHPQGSHQNGEYQFNLDLPDESVLLKLRVVNKKGGSIPLPKGIKELKLKQLDPRKLNKTKGKELGAIKGDPAISGSIPIVTKLSRLYIKPYYEFNAKIDNVSQYDVNIFAYFKIIFPSDDLMPNMDEVDNALDGLQDLSVYKLVNKYGVEDINTYLRVMIWEELGGFFDDGSKPYIFLLNGNKNGCFFDDEYKQNYLVFVISAVDMTKPNVFIDYFFDKDKQPGPVQGEKDTRQDIFDELLPVLEKIKTSLKDCFIKILFNYKNTEGHWLTCEIRIHKDGDNCDIFFDTYDSRGQGQMKIEDYKLLMDLIEKKFQLIPLKIINSQNRTTNLDRRLAKRDIASSGVLAVDEIIKRIRGDNLKDVKRYSYGALSLRKHQLSVIDKYLLPEDVDSKKFIKRNTAVSIFVKTDFFQKPGLILDVSNQKSETVEMESISLLSPIALSLSPMGMFGKKSQTKTSISQANNRPRVVGDGNCAFNAVALGVFDLMLKDQFPNNDGTKLLIKKLSVFLNLQEASLNAIKQWLEGNLDSDKRQLETSFVFRELAVDEIEKQAFDNLYDESLWAAYENLSAPHYEDEIFLVHEHIKEKFKEKGLSKNDLLTWWRKSGKEAYLKTLAEPAKNSMDKQSWGSEVEIGFLANLFEINIIWKKNNGQQLLGIGGGKISGLNDEDKTRLQRFNLIESYEDHVNLKKQMSQKDFEGLLKKFLPLDDVNMQKLKELLEKAKQVNPHDRILPKEQANLIPLLENLGILIKIGNQYQFIAEDEKGETINEKAILNYAKGIDKELTKILLESYRENIPVFTLSHQGAHWTYDFDDLLQITPKLG